MQGQISQIKGDEWMFGLIRGKLMNNLRKGKWFSFSLPQTSAQPLTNLVSNNPSLVKLSTCTCWVFLRNVVKERGWDLVRPIQGKWGWIYAWGWSLEVWMATVWTKMMHAIAMEKVEILLLAMVMVCWGRRGKKKRKGSFSFPLQWIHLFISTCTCCCFYDSLKCHSHTFVLTSPINLLNPTSKYFT
jgi:hypothetical protein